MSNTSDPSDLTQEIEELKAEVDHLQVLEEESQRRYHTLERVSPVGIFHTDAEGECLYVNHRWCEMTGLTAQQAHGQGWCTPLHPEDRDRVREAWRRVIKEGKIFRQKYRFVRPDGSIIWVLGQAAPEIDEDGNVVGHIRTATDITDQVEIEDALRESEEKFRVLSESVHAGIVIYQGGVIRHVNRGITDLTGFEVSELIGRKFGVLIHPEHRSCVIEAGKMLEREEPVMERFEVKMVTKDDQERWVDYSLGVLEYGGQPALIGSAFDITDRKRAERLAALGMTASGLAHYIKNVQTHLMGSMTLIDSAMEKGDQDTVSKAWPLLRRATRRINTLVRDMLSLARETKSSPRPVHLDQVIGELIEDLKGPAEESGVRIVHCVEEDLPPIAAEESRLHDSLLNLTGNAIEAIQSVGREDGLVHVEARRSGDGVEIVVTDNGPGMPPEIQDKVFDPFYTTKGTKGTGLGLAVVKRTVEDMGGSLDLKSAPDKGATFTIGLPAHPDETD